MSFVIASCAQTPSEEVIRQAANALLTEQAGAPEQPTLLPSATPTPEPTSTPAPMQLTSDQLSALSLQITDMRSGYTFDSEEVLDINSIRARGANRTADYLETIQPFSAMDVVFVKGSILDFSNVRSRVLVLPNQALASSYLDIHPTLFGDEGTELQPVSYDKLADETKAYLTKVTSGDFEFTNYFVIFRKSNVIVAINYSTLAGFADLSELDQYVRALEGRLLQAVP